MGGFLSPGVRGDLFRFHATGIQLASVWGGPLAGWRRGGEVGSPIWARIWAMGAGSVRNRSEAELAEGNAMKVRGVWQEGQVRGNTS